MEQTIELVLGTGMIVIGLSCLIRTENWIDWCRKISDGGQENAVVLGAWSFMLCALITGFHPVWSGPAMLLTVISSIGMAESLIYLFFPAILPKIWSPFLKSKTLMRICSLGGISVGLSVLYICHQNGGF